MKKILIIDDDTTFQKTMRAKLESLNYEVSSATDGEEGLNKATTEKPDLLLLDIRMPKMDGMTMLKKLRDNKDTPQPVVFITSNMSTDDNISDGVLLGVKGYIIKSNETLDTIVREVESTLNPTNK
ncbi:MAG: response regulator [Nitrospira sp.]